jgi:Fic family protein
MIRIASNKARHYIWQQPDWPQWRWSGPALNDVLASIQRKRDFLAGLARGLDADHLNLAVTELMTQETVSTSAIEGVKLDAAEVRSSIMRRLGLAHPDSRHERLALSGRGLVDVLADSTQNLAPLTMRRLFGWHEALFPTGRSGLSAILVGALRGEAPMQIVSGPAGRERVHYEAPPRKILTQEMRRLLKWFNARQEANDTTRAAIAHLWFETLHPFEDGNGRLGRAVFDLALAQGATFHSASTSRLWAVSPVILQHRKDYYLQLERAQHGELDITEWLLWSAQRIEQACDDARICIERVVAVAQFWTRHREVPFNVRQRRLLEMALTTDGREPFWLTAKFAARVAKVERVTASRDLARLEELNVIRRDPAAGGRSTRYEVILGQGAT